MSGITLPPGTHKAAVVIALVVLGTVGMMRETGAQTAPAATVGFDDEELFPETTDDDPFEPLNRRIYAFNQVFYQYASDPPIRAYNDYVPEDLRAAIGNFFGNLREPFSAAKSAMAGDWERSEHALHRFAVNSTFGLLGVLDVAKEVGLEKRDAFDFNEVMCAYDVPPGPFIVLPVLGPTNARSVAGRVADVVTAAAVTGDFAQVYLPGVYVHEFMHARDVETMLAGDAIDAYALIRSAYGQVASACGDAARREPALLPDVDAPPRSERGG